MYSKIIVFLLLLGAVIGGIAWLLANPVVLAVSLTLVGVLVAAVIFLLGSWWTKRIMESGAAIANSAIQYSPVREELKTERERIKSANAAPPPYLLPSPTEMQSYVETAPDRQMIDTSSLIIENLPPYESED